MTLTPLGGRGMIGGALGRGYRRAAGIVDDFTTLDAATWTALVGTAAASAGKLQGSTLAGWLSSLITNGELTSNTTGWNCYQSTIARVDSETDPGAASGGADKYALKISATGTWGAAYQVPTVWVIGATYIFSARGYAPSANTGLNAFRLRISGTNLTQISAEDVWQALACTWVATATNHSLNLTVGTQGSIMPGDVAYADAVSNIRQNVVLLLATGKWTDTDATIICDIVNPASGVVPFGLIVRYTDALNYWEIRQVPGTAGNDTHIIEVVAGVETIRASADVDWTVGATDQMKVVLSGDLCTVSHKKNGAADFTAACNYTMTTGLDKAQLGLLLYNTGAGRLDKIVISA